MKLECGVFLSKTQMPGDRNDAVHLQEHCVAENQNGPGQVQRLVRISRTLLRHRGQRVGIAGQKPAAVGLFAEYRHAMTGELHRLSAGARGHR